MGGVETRGEVWVYRLSDGCLHGKMKPSDAIGPATGWVDMVEAIEAVQRENGKYVVYLEEGARNKILVYRWTP